LREARLPHECPLREETRLGQALDRVLRRVWAVSCPRFPTSKNRAATATLRQGYLKGTVREVIMASSFNEAYRGTPPWDIGRPQAEFVKVAREGGIRGSVLDVGCGTGENAIFFAGLGQEAWGLDAAPLAIEKARRKAAERAASAKFVVGDALHLDRLGRRFETITDCGLFHVFSDDDRRAYVKSLKKALNTSGAYVMLCFSDEEPTIWGGPRRVTRDEILEAFSHGWKINYVRAARFSTTFNNAGGRAWLSSIASV
jgi:SAM-dependent methyltransferase